MVKVRKAWDSARAGTWRWNPETDVLSFEHAGETTYPSGAERARGLALFARRDRASANKRERESIMRSCGLVKVRGALGGVYWE